MLPEYRIVRLARSWPILGTFLIATLLFSLLAGIAFAHDPALADADT